MSGKTVLVGWHGTLAPACASDALRLDPAGIFRESFAGCTAIVLGPAAIDQLAPSLAWSALASMRGRIVLCADASLPYVIARPWTRCGFPAPVVTEDLPERLMELRRTHVRPWIEYEQWLRCVPDPGSQASVAVSCVHTLRSMRVGVWADHLGWSNSRLQRVCRGAFGAVPKQVLLSYVRAAFDRLRRDGATCAVCVDLLAYADETALRRALHVAVANRVSTVMQIAGGSTSNCPVQVHADEVSSRKRDAEQP